MPKLPIILAVEHVRSSYNVGSLFRTGAAAGIEQIILSPFCPTPERSEVAKTALGGEKAVPWETADLPKRLQELKSQGYTLAALEQGEGSTNIFQTAVSFPLVLILGHEREGVSAELLVLCDHHLELPMADSPVHSLNVASAGAIALYELGRKLWYD